MYSIVGSHLWIRLIFSSSSRGAGAHFQHYKANPNCATKTKTKRVLVLDSFLFLLEHKFRLYNGNENESCTSTQLVLYLEFVRIINKFIPSISNVVTKRAYGTYDRDIW